MIRAAVERLSLFAADQGLPLDTVAIDRLTDFLSLLEVWNRKTRLTGDRDTETLVAKHCADSLVAASELSSGGRALDVGSGAGFPGLVAACLRPDVAVTLVDSREKACSFLDAAGARASLPNLRVLNRRVEEVSRAAGEVGAYDSIVSRGVNLTPLVTDLRRLVGPSGTLLAMVSGRQRLADRELLAGFKEQGERAYALPSGEDRRIVRYAPV